MLSFCFDNCQDKVNNKQLTEQEKVRGSRTSAQIRKHRGRPAVISGKIFHGKIAFVLALLPGPTTICKEESTPVEFSVLQIPKATRIVQNTDLLCFKATSLISRMPVHVYLIDQRNRSQIWTLAGKDGSSEPNEWKTVYALQRPKRWHW